MTSSLGAELLSNQFLEDYSIKCEQLTQSILIIINCLFHCFELLSLLVSILIILLSKEDKHCIQITKSLIAKELSKLFLFVCTLLDNTFSLLCSLSLFLLVERRLRFEFKLSI